MDELIPIFVPAPLSVYPEDRIQWLEQELAACQSVLGLVLYHLGQTQNPIDLSSPLGQLLAADDLAAADQIASEVDRHLAAKKRHLALRLLHEETAMPWVQLYVVVRGWSLLDARRKRHWVRFARLGKLARDAEQGAADSGRM